VIEPRLCARPDCAKPFTPTDRRQVYCEHACALKASQRRLQGKDEWGRYPARECERPDCRRMYVPMTKKSHYCSPRCTHTMSSRKRTGAPLDMVYADRQCRFCGKTFTPLRSNANHCSTKCQHRAENAKVKAATPKPAPRPCAVCGRLYTPPTNHLANRYCSIPCRNSVGNERAKVLRATDESARIRQMDAELLARIAGRMRDFGSTATLDRSVTTTACIERFGTECHWCGQEMNVERTVAAKQRGDAVTIDHLLPISAHGPHTWENVVLACRRCNTEKGTDVCLVCGGPISELGEPVCAKCLAKRRGPKQNYAVCANGHVDWHGGWCSTCKSKVWLASGLTKVAANAMSRSLQVTPDTTGWVVWMVA
jgi:hypothetical protein